MGRLIIYFCLTPDGGVYFGQTCKALRTRISWHLYAARCLQGRSLFAQTIARYKADALQWGILSEIFYPGRRPSILNRRRASEVEVAFMRYFSDHGLKLLNSRLGGSGLINMGRALTNREKREAARFYWKQNADRKRDHQRKWVERNKQKIDAYEARRRSHPARKLELHVQYLQRLIKQQKINYKIAFHRVEMKSRELGAVVSEEFRKSITFNIMSSQREVLRDAIRELRDIQTDGSLTHRERESKLFAAIERACSLLPESQKIKDMESKHLGEFHDVLG